MSDVVLARKYRPRSFAQMVGQAHVVQALSHALQSGRLHHAYLFTGTRGIGKTTVSRILAKSLNCTGADGTGGVTDQPCGVCQACTEVDADRYIDYIELDAASNRSIDEIRELIERAAYKPSVGRYKVFMIDEAHQLTKDAFNALLKTLEEPPDYLKFVLATTDPDKMLPTVLSRCLQFNLRPMAPETVREHLQQVLQAEGVAADAGALRLLARAARGSMRDALSLTDQAIAYGGGQLEEAGVRAMLGTVDRRHAATLVQGLARRDGPAVLATLDDLRAQGLSPAGTLEEMATLLQQMAVEQVVPGALDDADPDTAAARMLAASLAPDETQLLYGIVLQGRAELSLVGDEHAGLTMALLRFLAFPPAGAAAPAPAPRAAPLVAPPAVARATAPARPAVVSPAVQPAVPAQPAQPAQPVHAEPAALSPGATATQAPMATPRVAASTAPPRPVAPPARSPATAQPPAAGPRPAPVRPVRPAVDDGPPPWVDDDIPLVDEDRPAAAAGPADSGLARQAPDGGAGNETAEMAEMADRAAWADGGAATRTARAMATHPVADDDRPRTAAALPEAAGAAAGAARLQTTALGQQWADWLQPLLAQGQLSALVRELAIQAELVDHQPLPGGGRRCTLRVGRETLRAANLQARLTELLQAGWGVPVQLEVQGGEAQDSVALRDAAAREAAQREAEQLIRQDAVVVSVLRTFESARIVPGSVRPVA